MKRAFLIATVLAACPALAGAAERDGFSRLDRDGSGGVTWAEVAGIMPGLAAGFDIADRNNDGRLSPDEFAAARALGANMYGEGRLSEAKRAMFRDLDRDGDRHIAKDEAAGRPALAAHFRTADRDGDGRLGVSEFGLVSLYTIALGRPLDENPAVPGRTHERFSFRDLDVNRDGLIARSEAAFRSDLSAGFAAADRDGDGRIGSDEFALWTRGERRAR